MTDKLMKPNLAEPPEAEYPLTFPKLGSSKLDGIRALSQGGTLTSRSLKPIPNLEVTKKFSRIQRLDGELIWGSPTDPQVFNQTSRVVRTIKASADNVKMYVFDLLDKTLPFLQRYDTLMSMNLPDDYVVIPQIRINSEEEMKSYYDSQLALGFEGIMLRNPYALYEEKRSTAKSQNLLKIKPTMESEAVILSVFEAMENLNEAYTNELGRTVRSSHAANKVGKGMAGGFNVAQGPRVFDVAAGYLNHEQRKRIWESRDKMVGKTITFLHLAVGEKDVPRHGRFYRFRDTFDMS